MHFFTPVTLLLPPTTCFCRVRVPRRNPGARRRMGCQQDPPHRGAAAPLPPSRKRLGMNLGDFPACTSPWQTHVAGARTDPPAHGKPRGWGSAVGLLLANPGIPAWDAVSTKVAFGVFAGVPPKTKAGHIALSRRAASPRLRWVALGEIKRGFRDHQPPAHPASVWLPTLFSHNIQHRRALVPGKTKLWVGDMLCRCHGPAAQSHGSARCSPLPAPISQ